MQEQESKPSIMIVTTGRADYGLLYPLIIELKQSQILTLQLVATGSHLSKQHGETLKQINEDNLTVNHIVPMLCDSDSEHAVCAAMAEGLNGFSALFVSAQPNLVLVLGDRYELLSICVAALMHKIPIAHIHGGEATFGLVDEAVRHCVTKMSTLHFPALERYKERIIQLGEHPENIYVIGALGVDNIKNMELIGSVELSRKLEIDFSQKIALVTYHPVTLDSYESSMLQIRILLDVLVESEVVSLVTMPNVDPGNGFIYEAIQEYQARYPDKIVFRKNLGQLGYLSAMRLASVMVGNSSSGIIESASFELPVINVGDRQKGRYKPDNVIDVECETEKLRSAIDKALSLKFKNLIAGLTNPYGDGGTAEKIVRVLEDIDYDQVKIGIKKQFYDLANHCDSD